jgi:alcohol dehydrogenase (cytochrome c)
LLATVVARGRRQGLAQTADELNNDGKNTDNVLVHSMGQERKSYSPLKQINKANIKRLVPIWSTSLMNDSGELAAPAIYNGVMYVINGKWTFAIDIETGKPIWRTPVEFEAGALRVTQFGAFNRGAPTLYNGKLFRVSVDNHLIAFDMKTGKEVWKQKFADWREGYLCHQRRSSPTAS